MKKLIGILVIALLFCSIGNINAQDKSDKLTYNETKYTFNLGAKDTIGIGDSTYVFQLQNLNTESVIASAYFDIDSVGGAASVTIVSSGKIHNSAAYTDISTVTWSMTGDTTFTMTESSKNYEYWRWTITGSASTIQAVVKVLEVKFLNN